MKKNQVYEGKHFYVKLDLLIIVLALIVFVPRKNENVPRLKSRERLHIDLCLLRRQSNQSGETQPQGIKQSPQSTCNLSVWMDL